MRRLPVVLVLMLLTTGGCYTPYKTAALPYDARMPATVQEILLHAKTPRMLHVSVDAQTLSYAYAATPFLPPHHTAEYKTIVLTEIARVEAFATGAVIAWNSAHKPLLIVACWTPEDARYLAAALMTLAER